MPPPSADKPAHDVEPALDRFESAWQAGAPPAIEAFLDLSPGDPDRNRLLTELIKVDLEYRWNHNSAPAIGSSKPSLSLEDYAGRFPELGTLAQLPVDLIAAEYRVRSWAGQRPNLAEYAQRFGANRSEIVPCLRSIDAELAREAIPLADPVGPTSPVDPPYSVSMLLDALREHRLLTLAQLNELILGDVRGHFPEPASVTQHCLDRGWLTSYQIELVLKGRGRELVLGSYLLLNRLGEGASGIVFRARHRSMNRVVALKVLRPELLGAFDAEGLRRFYQEMRAVGQLSHPHVVHAFDAGPAGSLHFLAMEFCEGIDLAKLLKEKGQLPIEQPVSYVRQAALGLEHAWKRGLVHRDIKPSNLMLANAVVKVLDFGLARLQRPAGASTLTHQTDVMGTADYMAPEQAADAHNVDTRADLYSLGCALYHLLAGRPPFPGGSFIQKVEKHRWEEPEPIERLRPEVPAHIAGVVRKLMAKRPEERFQTPTQLLAALPAPDIEVPAESGAASRKPLAHYWPFAIAASLAVACVLLALMFLVPLSASRPTAPATSTSQAVSANAPRFVLSADNLTDDQLNMVTAGGKTPAELVEVIGDSRRPHRFPLRAVAIAPVEPLLAYGSPDDFSVRLWNLQQRKTVRIIGWRQLPCCRTRLRINKGGHRGEVFAVAFSPDGKQLATAGRDFAIKLWNVATGRLEQTLVGHQNLVNCLSFHPSGKWLASGSLDHTVKIWDIASGSAPQTLKGHKVYLTAVAFSPDGELVASGSDDRTVRVWDWRTSRERCNPLTGHSRQISSVNWRADSRLLASSSQDCTLILWDPAEGKEIRSLTFDLHPLTAAAFAPVGSVLITGSEDGTVRQIDTECGAVERTLPLGPASGAILQLAFSRDGRYLATANAHGSVYVLQVR